MPNLRISRNTISVQKLDQRRQLAEHVRALAGTLQDADHKTIRTAISTLLAELAIVMPAFEKNGGMAVVERPNLYLISTASDPLGLPQHVLRAGLLEGAQQLWAATALLNSKVGRVEDSG